MLSESGPGKRCEEIEPVSHFGRLSNVRHFYISSPFSEMNMEDEAVYGMMNIAGAIAKILDRLKTRGRLKGTDIANITAVSPATISRWTAGKAFPYPKNSV